METNLQDRKQMSCCLGAETIGKDRMSNQKETQEKSGWKWIFAILTVLTTLQVYANVRTQQIMQFKYTVYANYTTIQLRKCFPVVSDGKESACNAGDLGLIPRLGRSPGKGNGNPLQYSCLENPMDRGDWRDTVYRVAKSWT